MGRLEELERRVTAVEEGLALESGLRASIDRDQADMKQLLRAQQRSIQALANTQSEHTATLARHTATLDRHTEQLDRHTEQLDRLETSVATLRADHGVKLDTIVTMLDRLIDRPDGR